MDVPALKSMEDAYLILMQIPLSDFRLEPKTQIAMSQLRDCIAEITGRTARDVQDHYSTEAFHLMRQREEDAKERDCEKKPRKTG